MGSTTLHQVESLLDKLTLSEQAALIERLARRMRLAALSILVQPQDLYGAWKDKFPRDVDLNVALRDIRRGWETEWDKAGEFASGDVLDFDHDAAVPEMHDRIIVGLARRLGASCISRDPLVVSSGLAPVVW